ncbi:palmitoyl-(protein) hydrolase [Aureococcus anophagefferens]|nr:palmitoyl-(protein) hydrolase [Aureococcus anophagefferens]
MASFDRSAILEIEETTRDHNRHDRSDVMHEVYSATAEELVDANGVEIRALSRLGEAPAADGSAVAVCALRAASSARRPRPSAVPGLPGAAARREILDGWASADSRRVALTRLGRAFASVDAAGAGRVGRHLFGKLLLRSRDKWGDGDGDDDDPALGDAFAAADRDGDGFVDLQDVVEWLSSAAQSQEKKNDRDAAPAAQRRFLRVRRRGRPRRLRGLAALGGVRHGRRGGDVPAEARQGAPRVPRGAGPRPAALLVLHPPSSTSRVDEKAVKLELTLEEQTETLTVAFGTEDACGEWWAAVSETLAIHRRLRARPPPDVPVVLFDEVGDDGDFEDVFEEAARRHARAGSKKHRRRSVRFSDADEVEVSRGFAFDRVVKQDGSVKWEVSTPRRAKSAWRTVVRLVIRPPRASYDVGELGPLSFEIPSLRDAQKKLACVRSDFTVVNDDGLKLACSLWSRVLDADDFDDRTTWRRPGKASTEKRPKAFEKPCVLYLHGNASCRLECLPHVAPLLMLGLRVCAVDTSGSGLSEGEFVTLGEREAKDAACVAAHLVAAKRASVVALYGRSMGGVAAILGGARKAAFGGARRGVVACVVADSPFASLAGLVDRLARNAACGALGTAQPADLAADGKPIDDALIRDVRGGARRARAKAAGFFAGLSARGALAESAAKAAIDAVTAEVKKRGADVASADAALAVAALDAPLLLVAANGDQLIPPRPNAGALLKLYANAKTGRRRASASATLELLLALKAPTKDRGGEFRSGMTDAREKAIARDISNIFCG